MKIYNLCSLSRSLLCFGKSVKRQKQLVRFDYSDKKPNALDEEMASDAKLIHIPGWFR